MVKNTRKIEDFTFVKKHKKYGLEMVSIKELKKEKVSLIRNPVMSDFQMGGVGNCSVVAALAALSTRPEFMSEIFPAIEHSKKRGTKIHFKLFCKGVATTLTVDDALPYLKGCGLAYARSYNYQNKYLASYFEKAYVKQTCYNSYSLCEDSEPLFVFSTFSDCMSCCYFWEENDPKTSLLDVVTREMEKGSSVVLSSTPDFDEDGNELSGGHSYTVVEANRDAIKLYDPNCVPVRVPELPSSIASGFKVDKDKGEFLVGKKVFDDKEVDVVALHSKNMYKTYFKVHRQVDLKQSKESSEFLLTSCKISVKEKSTFMVNFFLYSHKVENVGFKLTTEDKKKADTHFELPEVFTTDNFSRLKKGDYLTQYFQRFELKAGKYEFCIIIELSNEQLKKSAKADFLLKIGSTSECSFKELSDKTKIN